LTQESPLFTKTYDLLAYVLAAVDKFPRYQRAVVGRRIQDLSWGFLDTLLAARKCTVEERPRLLTQADVTLDRLRYTVRMCRELELLSKKQYAYASGVLAEVGRLLGKWLQRYNPK
jgi:hypothetical protein